VADSFLPIALTLLAAIGMAAGILGLTHIVGRVRGSRTDLTPYECGMPPFESARHRFSVKFYLVGMLFILFDVEVAFLYPWALTLHDGGRALFVFGEMAVFGGVLVLGYIYVWRRGALEWD
jgi:NADH-quinone oxidoreductase subunit A